MNNHTNGTVDKRKLVNMLRQSVPKTIIAKKLGIGRTTLYRILADSKYDKYKESI